MGIGDCYAARSTTRTGKTDRGATIRRYETNMRGEIVTVRIILDDVVLACKRVEGLMRSNDIEVV